MDNKLKDDIRATLLALKEQAISERDYEKADKLDTQIDALAEPVEVEERVMVDPTPLPHHLTLPATRKRGEHGVIALPDKKDRRGNWLR